MELRVDREMTINGIQKEFNGFYPFLKIEFFRNRTQGNKPPSKAERINPEERISTLTRIFESGRINIDGNRTVAQFGQELLDTFGLSVQVFRKSGNLWIETSLTDNWSLEKQNTEGKLLNSSDRKSLNQQIEDNIVDSD